MMKFTKRPVLIEAFRYGFDKRPHWMVDCEKFSIPKDTTAITFHTIHGEITGMPGDYIIKSASGDIYPCKQELFEATYMPFLES